MWPRLQKEQRVSKVGGGNVRWSGLRNPLKVFSAQGGADTTVFEFQTDHRGGMGRALWGVEAGNNNKLHKVALRSADNTEEAPHGAQPLLCSRSQLLLLCSYY